MDIYKLYVTLYLSISFEIKYKTMINNESSLMVSYNLLETPQHARVRWRSERNLDPVTPIYTESRWIDDLTECMQRCQEQIIESACVAVHYDRSNNQRQCFFLTELVADFVDSGSDSNSYFEMISGNWHQR